MLGPASHHYHLTDVCQAHRGHSARASAAATSHRIAGRRSTTPSGWSIGPAERSQPIQSGRWCPASQADQAGMRMEAQPAAQPIASSWIAAPTSRRRRGPTTPWSPRFGATRTCVTEHRFARPSPTRYLQEMRGQLAALAAMRQPSPMAEPKELERSAPKESPTDPEAAAFPSQATREKTAVTRRSDRAHAANPAFAPGCPLERLGD